MKILDLIPENLREQLYKEVVETLKKESTSTTSKDLLNDLVDFVKKQDQDKDNMVKETVTSMINQIMP